MTTPSSLGRTAPSGSDLLDAGRLALARGAWAESRDLLTAALAQGENPQTLESLAVATFWARDIGRAVDLRQRAYRLYVERGDRRGAARVAIGLALDYEHYLGETAVASGWKERAARLLEDVEPCAEHAWLAVWKAHHAILFHHEIERGRALLSEAMARAHDLGLAEVELLARGLYGFTLVTEGKLADGMRYLDEAATAAIAGELRDPEMRGQACCYVMTACEQVGDLVRAGQWHRQVRDRFVELDEKIGLTFCRKHYVNILLWSGEWAEAEAELERLRAEMMPELHPLAAEAKALLGELRRRQGRRDEASALFEEEAAHPRSLLGRAELDLDGGRSAAALRLADRYLRELGDPIRTDHVPGLWVVVRAAAGESDVDRAAAAATTIDVLASALGTELMRGLAAASWGQVARARGEHESARRHFEEAVALFSRSRAPFEMAHARLDLAETLLRRGDPAGAGVESRAALAAFTRLGAAAGAARAARLLEAPDAAPGAPGGAAPSGVELPLSDRELEVLKLVANGLSNAEIAQRLFLSAHTVKRHVANILGKLELPTRAAAAAFAVRSGLG
jgi:LuxR family transcriptional regulator, maltose regulon positive regulatory protein